MNHPLPPAPPVIHRNIRAMLLAREAFDRQKSGRDRVADGISAFTGSLPFVYLHVAVLVAWLVINTGQVAGIRPFDPYPFAMLAMIASVEAIFLSTFVLITQNRMQKLADRRAEVDLQINLLAEHEVTRILTLVDEIAGKLGVEHAHRAQLDALKQDVVPEQLLEALERAESPRTP